MDKISTIVVWFSELPDDQALKVVFILMVLAFAFVLLAAIKYLINENKRIRNELKEAYAIVTEKEEKILLCHTECKKILDSITDENRRLKMINERSKLDIASHELHKTMLTNLISKTLVKNDE